MKAVMYGAGNIGRGFLGALFSRSGYEVTFIDVAEPVVDALNRDGRYPVRIVSTEGFDEMIIAPVRAINGRDEDAAARAIAEADVMATAVGVNVMKFIAPVIAKGLRLRFEAKAAPLNIILCENLIDANKVMEGMLRALMTDGENAWFDAHVGLVEASIGRMVPVQTAEMQDGNPLRVSVERYGFLPVDKDAFRGEIPKIDCMRPFSPFDYYIRRKLFLHNMGHATCAYLGMLKGLTYIYQAIDDPDARLICQSAMTESATALSKAYGVDIAPIIDHVFDLLVRFENVALQDTCARVGGDTVRKLGRSDRLIGAALECMKQGVVPAFIAVGIAAALNAHITDSESDAEATLVSLSNLDRAKPEDGALIDLSLRFYALIKAGADARALRKAADRARVNASGDIV